MKHRLVGVLSVLTVVLTTTASALALPVKDIAELARRSAGGDPEAIARDVRALADLAQRHIDQAGLAQAITDFIAAPWKRPANGLHLWGVNTAGMSWFDAGHPDLVGLRVSGMTDIEGRNWWKLAIESATGTGKKMFMLLYPHPQQSTFAAKGYHRCFMLEDGERVLCAGAFEDPG